MSAQMKSRRRQPLLLSSLFTNGAHAAIQTQSQINLQRPTTKRSARNLQGAFNPALTSFDPNSVDYSHNTPSGGASAGAGEVITLANPADYGAPSDWIQCPPGFEGHVASYDCNAYIMCSDGTLVGEYLSCMGLKFDNGKGVCDWGEDVTCDSNKGVSSGGDGDSGEEQGLTFAGEMETATAFRPMGGSWEANEESSSGKKEEPAAWNGGSDWGGSWVEGVWVPAGEEAATPASVPAGEEAATPPASKPATPPSETAWVDQAWDPSQITSYPRQPLTPADEFLSQNPKDTPDIKVPREFKSPEGWSVASRQSKTLTGYYASWRYYANQERTKPMNMKFQKVDRVNYAFFQTNSQGDIWGTDPWADPLNLFGPVDWMTTVQPELNYAPQFNDDNGFDDSVGDGFNYVGAKYVDLGEGVKCHRSSPTGKRDCKAYLVSQGLIGRAQSQGAQVYISIGGWSLSDAFPTVAASPQARRNFAKNVVGLVREYGIDGVDIDWEFPGYEPHQGTSSDKQNFILLLKDIRAALDSYQKVVYPNGEKIIGITAALPCVPQIIDGQDVAQISSIVTEMNLMTFDFHGTWEDLSGVNAPLFDEDSRKEYSVDGCVQRWIKDGADSDKINIGLPFYGRSFGGATKLYSSHSGADDIHWWEDKGKPQYYAILEKLPDMISLRDDTTKTQIAYFDDEKGGLVSYDDNQAICDKIEYALSENLHGYSIWDLSGDLTEDLATPLLDVVNIKLEKGDTFDCSLFRAETRDENGQVIAEVNAEEPNPWYANWEIGECVNDGKQSTWEKEENLFRFKTECCSYKFEYRFDECLGPATYAPTDDPTDSPSLSPIQTPAPTDNPTHIYGAAKVITLEPRLDALGKSPTPTASVTRQTEEDTAVDSGADPNAPVTFCFGGCKGPNEICVGNQNNPQTIDDETCASCLDGQTFWPCDVDGLCFCWDPSTPRVPPAPASGKAQLSDERPCDYFTEAMYNELGPNATFPYTYEGLCLAIDHYNEGHAEKIFMMGTDEEKKHELAAFLGHTLHESDEWKAGREYLICADNKQVGDETYCKPCNADEFDWETFKCTGVGMAGGGVTYNGYCDYVIEPPIACPCDGALEGDEDGYIPASKVFFGRGAIQLSWNYNFRAASEALTSDPNTFCENPDLVATTPEYAWGAGIFFWMENLKEETTCHIEALRNHDFGGTLNNVNGGLECPAYHGGWHGEAIKMRLNRYCRASATLGLDSIMVMDGCKELNASFAECLGDDTCPACVPFADSIEVIASSGHDEDDQGEDEGFGDATTVAATVGAGNETTIAAGAGNETNISASTVAAQTTGVSPGSTTAGSTPAAGNETTTFAATAGAGNETTVAASTVAAQTTGVSSGPTTTGSTPATGNETTIAASTPSAGNETTISTSPGSTVAAQTTTSASSGSTSAASSTAASSTVAASGSTSATEGSYTTNAATTESTGSSTVAGTTISVSSECTDGYQSVEGMPGCCVPEIAYLGDGACDPDAPYNTAECNWDGGDCCKETCNFDTNYGCANEASQGYGPFGYFCLNPELEEYVNPDECTVSDRTRLGDGRCDAEYNTEECNWDSGDCCEATCDDTYAYFACGDPEFPFDCKDEALAGSTTTAPPESSTVASTTATSTVGSSTTSTAYVAEDPSLKVTVAAAQLATIFKNDPDTPHGGDDLQIKGTLNDAQDVLLEFVVPASESDPSSAVLRVYSLTDSVSGGIFHLVSEAGSWSDQTVTWNNAPDYTSRLGNLDQVKANKWYEIDVTNVVEKLGRKRGPITVRIRSRNPSTADFSSRKGGNTPELRISYPLEQLEPEATIDSPSINEVVPDYNSGASGFVEVVTPQEEYTTSNIVTVEGNGMYVSVDEYSNSGDGSYFYPVWEDNGVGFCSSGSPPSWATGPYLKKTKKQCCDSYFMLQKLECMSS